MSIPSLTLKIRVNQNGTIVPLNQTVVTVGAGTSATAAGRLDTLEDVIETSPANNSTLIYDADTDKYVVKEIPEIDAGIF
jgi:hypothetical protein